MEIFSFKQMLKSRKNFIYLFTPESNASRIANTYFKINIKNRMFTSI